MDERALPVARVAVRCLYPEPGTASVEYELMRLVLAAKVHCREDLDVKEVRQVLFQKALTVTSLIRFIN